MPISSIFKRRKPDPRTSGRTPDRGRTRSADARPPAARTPWPDWVEVPTPAEAIEVFTQAMNAVPVVDTDRALAGYARLRHVWQGAPVVGSLPQISRALQANLERDATLPGHDGFLITILTDDLAAIQVHSVRNRTARAYRAWRAEGRAVLFGSPPDMILGWT